MKDKFFESKTYLFGMVWPWLVLIVVLILDTAGIVDPISTPPEVVLSCMIAPVIFSIIWFMLKRKRNHPTD